MPTRAAPAVLLVGPYDPTCGEYTFLAPPLGVWRLAGVLQKRAVLTSVFDPNCCGTSPEVAFEQVLRERHWDLVGFSTTGMTLRHDLSLAHIAKRISSRPLLLAGGMEATFAPERVLALGPFDLIALGEGERPLLDVCARLRARLPVEMIPGTAFRTSGGEVHRIPQDALSRDELRDAIFSTPYEQMPYEKYWTRLEAAYRVGALPFKTDREARLAEIRSVRLITLNYCPMRCTFCSSTNFLNVAQGSTARLARLDADECLTMIRRIVATHPSVQTIIFQDDIFVFPNDHRILSLCSAISEAKERGDVPRELQFISTNRIDAMTDERLLAMRRAGFRVSGFGIESFSQSVLAEFNKAKIFSHIAPVLTTALNIGITPFLDLILTSPSCTLRDLAETIRQAYRWMSAGAEVGMYPYVIPFSGAALSEDPQYLPATQYTKHRIAGTNIEWEQPSKILPFDARVRAAILEIEHLFTVRLETLQDRAAHLPSRVRSLLWVLCAIPVLTREGEEMPQIGEVEIALQKLLPAGRTADQLPLPAYLSDATGRT